jgi:hypothetical protein
MSEMPMAAVAVRQPVRLYRQDAARYHILETSAARHHFSRNLSG